jgi:hypothetical protein
MAGVPVRPGLGLSAQLEQAGVSSTINTFVTGEADLVFSNSPPVISNLVAILGGQEICRAPAGATVHVTATAGDPDGDTLQYRWFLPDGTSLPATNGAAIDWTLPNVADGFHYLFLRVSDGKGGYDTARLGLTTNPYLEFSGQVAGSDLQLATNGTLFAPPVSNAVVQVNQLTTRTDGNGYFSLLVTGTNEYVLDIIADGYAPLAKVFQEPESDREYRLLKISSAPCTNDTSQPICVTAGVGALLCIPANSLQDSNGLAYPGASVAFDLFDPCNLDNQFNIGNFVYTGTGTNSVLDPIAVASIQFTNCYGQPLFVNPTNCLLNPNSAACVQLFLPITASCAVVSNAPPATAGFFFLDPALGLWRDLAVGILVTNGPVRGYVVNTVLPQATKIVIAVGNALQQWGGLIIRADTSLHVPFRVGFFKDNNGNPGDEFVANGNWRDIFFITGRPGANPPVGGDGASVFGLPVGPVWIKLLDLRQAPGEFSFDDGSGLKKIAEKDKTVIQQVRTNVASFATLTFNRITLGLGMGTGRKAELTVNNRPNPYPTEKDNVRPVFLNGLRARPLVGSPAGAANYYAAIGATNLIAITTPFAGANKIAKTTFARWQIINGWTPTGWSDDIGAVKKINGKVQGTDWFAGDNAYGLYFNANDLGAGRRMGMKSTGDQVAYYVATYASLADAEAGQNLKYVVCMEYSPWQPSTGIKPNGPQEKWVNEGSYIKFYAYGPDGNLTATVPDEDRHRPTNVPEVCMVCHGGGTFDPANPGKGGVGGQFVVFDTANYTFSSQADWTREKLAAQFTELNTKLLKSAPVMGRSDLNALILQIKDLGYTTTPLSNWQPQTEASTNRYNLALAVSCRSCHSTQAAGDFNGNGGGGRRKLSSLGGVRGDMPQAQRTFSIFWGSATAQYLLNPTGNNSQPAILDPDYRVDVRGP